jgi:hypothetical protein
MAKARTIAAVVLNLLSLLLAMVVWLYPQPILLWTLLGIATVAVVVNTGLVIKTREEDLSRKIEILSREKAGQQTDNADLLAQLSDRDRQNRDLQSECDDLRRERDTLQNEREQLVGNALNGLKPIIGVEHLVDHWRIFKPTTEMHTEYLYQKIFIALSIAALEYKGKLKFIRYFPSGTRIDRGTFLIQPPNARYPRVLKFDSWSNLEKEATNFADYVFPQLPATYRQPYIPKQRRGYIKGSEWGAVIYDFVDQKGNAADPNQLLTFGEYYQRIDDLARIEQTLRSVLNELNNAWWDPQLMTYQMGKRPATVYDEYFRITRNGKYNEIRDGIRKALDNLGLGQIRLEAKKISLDGLQLCNPLYWVTEFFEKNAHHPNHWLNSTLIDSSVVHGDFHSGNILVTSDNDGNLQGKWVIDFSDVHIGPTVQDIACLAADIKFHWLSSDTLSTIGIQGLYDFERALQPHPPGNHPNFPFPIPNSSDKNTPALLQLKKTWSTVGVLQEYARNYMIAAHAPRPYYLALLHATLLTLRFYDHSDWQKLYAFISAAWLCKCLES